MEENRLARATRRVDLIGVASGMGGADAACAQAPAKLAAAGLESQLRAAGVDASWIATLAPKRQSDGVGGIVARLSSELATLVAASVRDGRLPCVIGGDHSCAVGTWSGVAMAFRKRGPPGLVWIGQGDQALAGLVDGVLHPRHVCVIGVRGHEPAEAALLERLGVRVFGIGEIERRGLAAVMEDALQIANEGTAGYGITLDVDAFDPREVPAVSTPSPSGIRGDDLLSIFARLGGDPWLAAFELVEYCPRLDPDGRSERLICRLLCAALGEPGEDPQVVANAID